MLLRQREGQTVLNRPWRFRVFTYTCSYVHVSIPLKSEVVPFVRFQVRKGRGQTPSRDYRHRRTRGGEGGEPGPTPTPTPVASDGGWVEREGEGKVVGDSEEWSKGDLHRARTGTNKNSELVCHFVMSV